MKWILMITAILLGIPSLQAQNFSEWFRQKKTQKKYLIEQIAALKVYGGYLKKGYQISQKGLGIIGDIKDGDFNLHSAFFSGLKTVNAKIANSPEVASILSTQLQIKDYQEKISSWYLKQGVFTEREKHYFKVVFQHLERDCLNTLSGLEQVTAAGKVDMSDDQRINRINQLQQDSYQQLEFVKHFSNGLLRLALQKKKQNTELETGRTWYGIK